MLHRRRALLTLCGILFATVSHAKFGPADAYGYFWADQDEPGIDTTFPPAIGPITPIAITDGGPMSPIYTLPIAFPFYDGSFTQFRASDNGWITFNTLWTDNQVGPLTLPSGAAPPQLIAFASGNLRPSIGANSFWFQQFTGGVLFRYTAEVVGLPGALQIRMGLYQNGVIKIHYEILNNKNEISNGIQADPILHSTWGQQPWHTGSGNFALAEGRVIMFFPPAALNCSASIPLACGAPTASTSPAVVSPNVSKYFCSPNDYLGRERVFDFTLTQISNVSVSLTDLFPAAVNLDLFVLAQEECNEFRCLGWSDAVDVNDTVDLDFLPPGRYYVVVDGRTNLDNGAFTIAVDCEPRGEDASCGAGPLSATNIGSSVWDTYSGCPGVPTLTGPEYLFRVPFAPPGNLRATLSNHAGTNLDVFIFDENNLKSGACLAYGDEEAILYNPDAGDYVILVDGANGASGSFDMTIGCDLDLDCSAPIQTLACQSPILGSTIGRMNHADRYSCAPGLDLDGPEAVYQLTHAGGIISFVLEGAPPDLRMQLVPAGCNEGACLASGGPLLSADAPPGDYYLVIDGENGAAGDFILTPICATALEPAELDVTLQALECTTESKTVYFNRELTQVDILVAVDASVGQTLVLPRLPKLIDDLVAQLGGAGVDLAFGVVSFVDYIVPSPATCGDPAYGTDFDYPYRLDQPITTNAATAKTALGTITPENGGDLAESYSRAWHETYTDPGIAWRPGSVKVVIMTGDDVPHECNVSTCIGGSSDPWGADPNAAEIFGDGDDLEIMTVMQNVAAANQLPILLFTPTSIPVRNDGLTFATVIALWDCWMAEGGGVRIDAGFGGLNPDTINRIDAAIRDSAATCNDMTLRASAGFASWLNSVVPPSRVNITAPTTTNFDIRICVPPATPAGLYNFDVELVCEDVVLAHQDVAVAVSACVFDEQPVIATGGTCRGDIKNLSGASSGIPVGCSGPIQYRWLDLYRNPVTGPAGTWSTANLTYDVTLLFDFGYIFQFRCQDQGQCLGFGEVFVPVPVNRPNADAGPDKSTCVGQPVGMGTACDLANNTYLWSPPTDIVDATACPATVNPAAIPPGNPWVDYTVTVTDPQGCTNVDTVRVFVSGSRVPAFVGNGLRAVRFGNDVNLDWTLGALLPPEYNVHKATVKTDLTPALPIEAPVIGGELWTDPGAVLSAAGTSLFYQAYQQDCDGTSVFP